MPEVRGVVSSPKNIVEPLILWFESVNKRVPSGVNKNLIVEGHENGHGIGQENIPLPSYDWRMVHQQNRIVDRFSPLNIRYHR